MNRSPRLGRLLGAIACVLLTCVAIPMDSGARVQSAEALESVPWIDGVWQPLAFRLHSFGHNSVYDSRRARIIVLGAGEIVPPGPVSVWSVEQDAGWKRHDPVGVPPIRELFSVAVYDSLGDRVILHGGAQTWQLSLSPELAWTQIAKSGAQPPGREMHSAVYDSRRHRVLIFGGRNSISDFNDVWALSLTGDPEWVRIEITGIRPDIRSGHAAVYDSKRDRMIVYGGGRDGVPGDQIWALDLSGSSGWSPVVAAGTQPPRRRWHTAVYDSGADQVVICGGEGQSTLGDVWQLQLADGAPVWEEVITQGPDPGPRESHAAVYDARHSRMVIVGGFALGYFKNDAWQLNLSGEIRWQPWSSAGLTPSQRSRQRMCYDPIRDRVLLFGGWAGSFNDELWQLLPEEGDVWERLSPAGAGPAGRAGHALIFDSRRNRLVLYGGASEAGFLGDVWELPLESPLQWRQLVQNGPVPRARAYFAYMHDPLRDRLIVQGGELSHFAGDWTNETWALDLSELTWERLQTVHRPPLPGSVHWGVYDSPRDRFIVFGGNIEEKWTWALEFEPSPEWVPIVFTQSGFGPRADHCMIFDPVRDRVILFGGGGAISNNVNELSMSIGSKWARLSPQGTGPLAHAGLSAVYDPKRDRMILFGDRVLQAPTDTWSLVWGIPPVQLPLDIRPGTKENVISIRSRGLLSALLFSSPEIDLNTIDLSSLRLGSAPITTDGNGARMVHWRDENGDGIADLLFFVRVEELGLTGSETSLEIRAQTDRGQRVTGVDQVILRSQSLRAGESETAGQTEGFGDRLLAAPNPILKGGALQVLLPSDEPAGLEIFDVRGALLHRRSLSGGPNHTAGITLAELGIVKGGIYFARILAGERSEITKLVVLP